MSRSGSTVNESSNTRIETGLLFPGRGEPLESATVVFGDGTITYAGPASNAPPIRGAKVIEVPFLLPGLWDSHVHFWGSRRGDSLTRAITPGALAGARSVHDARLLLMGGFTSVRELGGHGVEVGQAIDEGSMIGPAVYAAGALLSITGGHADVTSLPHPFPDCLSQTRRLCNGVDDCVTAVREQIRRGAQVIKVCVSGGVMSDSDVEHQQFSDEELAAMVGEARRAGRSVAAHAHGKAGIMAALSAGVHTIEHGSHLDEEAAALMSTQRAVLVPTRAILEATRERKDELPPTSYARGIALEEANRRGVLVAQAYGVRIAMGSDLGWSGSTTSHGYGAAAREIAALVEAGLTPLEAIEAATANGPATLGPRAPKSGHLMAGYAADAIAIDFDPLSEPDTWGDTNRVTHVWKGALKMKAPEIPVV
jgi:imidazolonepropionase-like amidohydrolase